MKLKTVITAAVCLILIISLTACKTKAVNTATLSDYPISVREVDRAIFPTLKDLEEFCFDHIREENYVIAKITVMDGKENNIINNIIKNYNYSYTLTKATVKEVYRLGSAAKLEVGDTIEIVESYYMDTVGKQTVWIDRGYHPLIEGEDYIIFAYIETNDNIYSGKYRIIESFPLNNYKELPNYELYRDNHLFVPYYDDVYNEVIAQYKK